MYDYATLTMQNKIFSELVKLNTSLDLLFNNFQVFFIIIILILVSFLGRKFILKCLGK